MKTLLIRLKITLVSEREKGKGEGGLFLLLHMYCNNNRDYSHTVTDTTAHVTFVLHAVKASQQDGPVKVDESSSDGGLKLLDMVLEFRRELYLKREEYDLMVSQRQTMHVAMFSLIIKIVHVFLVFLP